MSGTYRSGRPGKPIEQHELDGTYRPDRHAVADSATGKPEKPGSLTGEASDLWDVLVQELGNVPKRIDSAALQSLCEIWGLYRKSFQVAELDPVDKVARTAVLGYLAAFDRLSARFGLTPADRLRLKFPTEPEESEFDRWLTEGVPRRDRRAAAWEANDTAPELVDGEQSP